MKIYTFYQEINRRVKAHTNLAEVKEVMKEREKEITNFSENAQNDHGFRDQVKT